ncbi:MAG TPA: NAD(P)-dependent oxidoreductase [Dongiaceae bacterium]|jgi:uncharacterized protein YbjT (DUF2867 family)|nr:NAD(P)-dependent oxidoreductase [Dongiaceae bacterium]
MPELVALTGATGFLGRATLRQLIQDGRRVRIFVRRFDRSLLFPEANLEIVQGNLFEPATQRALLMDSTAFIHIAGLTRARNAREFFSVNDRLTRELVATRVRVAPESFIIHISSLAAREAWLSPYGASKRAGEDHITSLSDAAWTVLRPPAIYGPEDTALRPLFALARLGLLPLPNPPGARVAMIHVEDMARAILACLTQPASVSRHITELSDECRDGYDHRALAAAASVALGRKVRPLALPGMILAGVARLNDWGVKAGLAPPVLLPHKLTELRYPSWSCAGENLSRLANWRPRFTLAEGLADTLTPLHTPS